MSEIISMSIGDDKAEGSVGIWVIGLIKLLTPEQKATLFQYVREHAEAR